MFKKASISRPKLESVSLVLTNLFHLCDHSKYDHLFQLRRAAKQGFDCLQLKNKDRNNTNG